METKLLTIRDVAEFLQLSEQTVQRYVLNKEIPCHKVKKVIRFRLSEIEKWVDEGGGRKPGHPGNDREGDLFADAGTAEAGTDGNEAGEEQA
jgi:PTS system nitrogen regulatory IIA component